MDVDRIERRENISIDEFVECFLEPNRPVILGATFTQHWPARRDWVTAEGTPNFERLSTLYPTDLVEVADCDTTYFSDHERTTMPLTEFIAKWQKGEQRLYCKDWHFTRSPSQYQAYWPLPHLSNDWLNTYYEEEKDDDYRFCYMGGQGTWTAFHEDVFRSYSWSSNICGQKRWILVPPGQNHLFTDDAGNWVHSLVDYDRARFPRLHELKSLELVQGPGETVFVPSGWWHQVQNIGDTISINHNWTNEFNLQRMFDRLGHDLRCVRHALRDVTDMEGFEDHAQMVLRVNSGMDFGGFFAFVKHMANVYLGPCNADSLPLPAADSEPRCYECARNCVDRYFLLPDSVRRALTRIDAVLEMLEGDPTTALISGDLKGQVAILRTTIAQWLEEYYS
ncbi:hypothetical protein GGI06_001812 [Coemansia sp. S85]|nr:hypothetical protein GGI06_001812 [Coemansia sp. S85]